MNDLTLNDIDWLQVGRSTTLHHAQLTAEQNETLDDYASLDNVTLDCGRLAGVVHIPGPFSRMSAKRCDRCCDKNGLPRGIGAPKNDAECRKILGLD